MQMHAGYDQVSKAKQKKENKATYADFRATQARGGGPSQLPLLRVPPRPVSSHWVRVIKTSYLGT
jgi:hypothetical protein